MSVTPKDGVAVETGEIVALGATFDMQDYLTGLDGSAIARQQALAAAYDAACVALIGPNDVQKDKGRVFKKKSAWRKLARHFGISVVIVRVEREVLPSANGASPHFVATVTARAIAPWGQAYEDLGACGTDEATGRRVITVADAIATASTRASNRAISNLIAMGEVSADEIHRASADEDDGQETLTPATDAETKTVLDDSAKAGLTKETFPAFYKEVTGREWHGLFAEDVKALLAECAKRIAKKRSPPAATA